MNRAAPLQKAEGASANTQPCMNKNGLLSAALAYVAWGLFPLYFHHLRAISALELVLHRTVWALICLLLLMCWRRRWAWIGSVRQRPRILALYGLSALLLSGNWLLYVWAVNHGRVLESSLGYFINPLFNVLLGVVFLGERPRSLQWGALGLALTGVLWLAIIGHTSPWVPLGLAISFGFYGLLKKTAPLDAMDGLTVETLLLAIPALPLLLWLMSHGADSSQADLSTWMWLIAAGPITAVPLVLFGYGAQRVSLATLGLLQYIGPTLQFLMGVLWMNETLNATRLLGFSIIWAALLLYSGEALWRSRRRTAKGTPR
jgi:chloramphenicol-sensitive protein RarD